MLTVPFTNMNLFSNSLEAMAIENGNAVNRFIEYGMDIANSDIDEYDSPEAESDYANSYDERNYDHYGKAYHNEQPSSYDDSYGDGDSYRDDGMYSKYPTKDKKFVCKEGPFEGFFVVNLEFCDVELPQGPSTINPTNVYTNVGETNDRIFTRDFGSAVANCDPGDTALSGSFEVGQIGSPEPGLLPAIPLLISSEPLATHTGWNITVFGINSGNGFVTPDVECFDNPPLRP